ncbi:MAG: hypothetical protein Q7T82_21400 [Armatimonadota bacterium]|nr:hypothetical protein [Armatimonadota bacterium]
MDKWILLWWILTAACVIWYSSITLYVTVRGAFDIRQMLRRLSELGGTDQPSQD